MAKQTVAEWIREGYEKYGRAYVMNGRLKAMDDIGHEYNEQNWNREVRRQINRVNGDDESIPDESFNVQTLDDSQKFHDINEEIFNVKKLVTNTWGGPQNPNQQVKVEYERKSEEFSIEKWAEAFRTAIDYTPVKAKPRHDKKADLTAIISIPDMHIGQLIWAESIGNHGVDYTPEIAAKLYMDAVTNLSAGLDYDRVDQIVFPIGEDTLNVDNALNTTTKGTPQVNSDPHHMITIGLSVMFQAIDFLVKKANVHIPVIPGNHDTMLSFMAGIAIQERYRNDKRVTVDNTPIPSKVIHRGDWAVMFIHSRKKPKDTLWLFPTEYPKEWAGSIYRDIYSGHTHHTTTFEEQAVRMFFLSSLCPKDAWHNENMYNAMREAQMNIYHDKHGKISSKFFRPTM